MPGVTQQVSVATGIQSHFWLQKLQFFHPTMLLLFGGMASMGHSQGGVIETPLLSLRGLHGTEANGNQQPTPWGLAGANFPLPLLSAPSSPHNPSWRPRCVVCMSLIHVYDMRHCQQAATWRTIWQSPSRRQFYLQAPTFISTCTHVCILGIYKNVYHIAIMIEKNWKQLKCPAKEEQ